MRRKVAQQKSQSSGGGDVPGRSDYEPYLTRRLARVQANIEEHVLKHGCVS